MIDFGFILGGEIDQILKKIMFENMFFLSIEFLAIFIGFWFHFGIPKSLKNRYFSKKWRFEGGLWSTIAFELLFEWILEMLELDFDGFWRIFCFFSMPVRLMGFSSCIFWGTKLLRTKLWGLGRRGADQADLILWKTRETVENLCGPPPPLESRRGAGLFFWCFFSNAFFFDFFRCWVDFGRFWESKTEAKIDFWEFFFRCIFRVRFGIEF